LAQDQRRLPPAGNLFDRPASSMYCSRRSRQIIISIIRTNLDPCRGSVFNSTFKLVQIASSKLKASLTMWIEVTACAQGDGEGALWGLDTKMQLWGMGQESAGGKWGPWNGPNWLSAPKLRNMAAV
ncbi:MAG TPA: hypothetical protein VJT09_02990, partial [Pyrinomonadaceae bacterium]|nr:hypothetical protein [Pyrinomonadaceae bacterium]